MIMEAETNRWLRGGAGWEGRQLGTEWMVEEIFDVFTAEMIVVIHF